MPNTSTCWRLLLYHSKPLLHTLLTIVTIVMGRSHATYYPPKLSKLESAVAFHLPVLEFWEHNHTMSIAKCWWPLIGGENKQRAGDVGPQVGGEK